MADVIADLPGLIAPEDAVRYAKYKGAKRCGPNATTATHIELGTRFRLGAVLRNMAVKTRMLEWDEQGKRYRASEIGQAYLAFLDAGQRWEEARAEYRRLKPFTRKSRGTHSHHQA